MRFLFHGMLGVSLAITAGGLACGVEARDAALSSPSALHTSPTHHASFARMDSAQAIAPPLPVSPRYGAEVSGSAVLGWRLTEGTDGARVEMSTSSDFEESKTHRIDVNGEELRLPPAFPPGVWYWRLRGRREGETGDRATPTWMLYVTDPSTAT